MIDNKKILEDIHNNLYLKDPSYTINIFLCGKKTSDKSSLRGLLYASMKENPKFNVVFPEWIFSSLDSEKYNLLHLEKELGSYVDAIVLPLEGLGTFAELGMFAQNNNLVDKLLIINDFKFKKEKSFINLGPIGLVKSKKPSNIKYFESKDDKIIDPEDFKKYIINTLLRFPKTSEASKSNIQNIFNLSRFLLFVIGIYQPITQLELISVLNEYGAGNEIPEHLVSASLQILINQENIMHKLIGSKYFFVLSENGHTFVFEQFLPKLGIVKSFSRMRAEIFGKKDRSKYKFKIEIGVKKFLDYIVT
jgi:hypothetical protein